MASASSPTAATWPIPAAWRQDSAKPRPPSGLSTRSSTNAGISIVAAITDTTDEQWQRLLATNLTGSFNVAREAARTMIQRRRGAIVNTASELALTGEAGYAAYTATKGAILAMTRALAAELAPHGVRVNAICPGATDTSMLRAEFATATDPAAARAEGEASIALGRLAQPDDIAQVVLFLLSDNARYVTGAHYLADGGRTSCFPTGSLTPAPHPLGRA